VQMAWVRAEGTSVPRLLESNKSSQARTDGYEGIFAFHGCLSQVESSPVRTDGEEVIRLPRLLEGAELVQDASE
jgi:hypothetical protein